MIFSFLSILIFAACCIVALRWGGRDERLAAIGIIAAILASNFASQRHYASTETGLLLIDVTVFAGLLVLALRSDRFWPLWAAAFQLIATVVHLATLAEGSDFAWAYYVALIFWTYPVVLALGAGTWLEGRHRRDWPLTG